MLRIRLRRVGGTNAPAYRIVVSDARRTPRASVVEEIGYYDPTRSPILLKLDGEVASRWIGKGAVASDTVKKLLVLNAKAATSAPAPAAAAPKAAEKSA